MDGQDWNHNTIDINDSVKADYAVDQTSIDIAVTNGTDKTSSHKDDDLDIVLEALKNPATAKLPRCIFRVPQLLRRHNVRAYEPDIVSIGPYHPRGRKQFQTTENLKRRYARDLCLHMDMSLQLFTDNIIKYYSTEKKLQGMAEFEKQARNFYEQPLEHLNRKDFTNMMILDGCFLVQLFRKSIYEEQRDNDDPLFNMDCMFQYLCHDLLLLENQIPWFVLECIYEFTEKGCNPEVDPSLRILILTALSSQRQLNHNCRSYLKHLDNPRRDVKDDKGLLHILDLIRTSIVFSFKLPGFEEPFYDAKLQLILSATALSEAGIKFKMSTKKFGSIMNIEYEDGVITIPHLAIGELTESIFRNLIAFEQCCHGRSHKITSYAVLMDNIIGSSKDMKFLCDKKIIGNWLSAESGSEFFNKLYNDTVLNGFYYGGLCERVENERTELRRWRAIFKRDYCSDLWKATSWIAAVILLVLTVMQTAYTVIAYYAPL